MKTTKWAALGSKKSWEWDTPEEAYRDLDKEFHFDNDPCKRGGTLGLLEPWGKMNYLNPPYGRGLKDWFSRALIERQKGNGSVFNVPARTDTAWFHDYVLPFADEIRFVRGRLTFGKAKHSAPFPSVIIIFRPAIPAPDANLILAGVSGDWDEEGAKNISDFIDNEIKGKKQ
ncbi:MAG: DNA N-6-adenine-methyltransferase [Candidatus Omnitrophota bacterium]|jgi:site-specific DNA-methyltransferase (adenine-specific)